MNICSPELGQPSLQALARGNLEEVATRDAEDASLYNENAINICNYYIHCFILCYYYKKQLIFKFMEPHQYCIFKGFNLSKLQYFARLYFQDSLGN